MLIQITLKRSLFDTGIFYTFYWSTPHAWPSKALKITIYAMQQLLQNLQPWAWIWHHTKHAFSCTTLHKAFTLWFQASYPHVPYTAQYVCPLQHVCFTLCVAFSAFTSPCVSACTYTRTNVAKIPYLFDCKPHLNIGCLRL